MNKVSRRLTLAIVYASFLTGCATIGHAPVTSLVTLNEKGPVAAGSAAGSSKVGRSEAWGILVFATTRSLLGTILAGTAVLLALRLGLGW